MIYPVYCVRDELTGYDANFLVQLNEQSAFRAFAYSVNGNNIQNFKPSDFSLYHVSDFDTESGEMKPVIPPKFIVNGAQVKDEK